jgi:hypothetical protein
MADTLNLSPTAASLLDMIEQQMGVSIEVAHPGLEPVRRSVGSDASYTLDDPEGAADAVKALRTGEVRTGTLRGVSYGIFPLRRARDIIGCLVVTRRTPAGAGNVEDVGVLARAMLESDIALNGQVTAAHALTRRLHGTLRFLGQLGTYDADRSVMQAVLHAATVWFDLDCCIYERRPDGDFEPTLALPAADQGGPAPQRIDAARVAQLVAARRFVSAGDLDELGLSGRREEVLVLPVGPVDPTWLIILSGGLDNHAELTFTAMARVLTSELQTREYVRIDQWQRELTEVAGTPNSSSLRALETMLERLVERTGMTSGRVTLTHKPSGRRTTATAGERAVEEADGAVDLTAAIGSDASAHVLLVGPPALRADGVAAARIWLRALTPWLLGVAQSTGRPAHGEAAAETTAFEQRIQEEVERARRFNLGLGLVLIGPGDTSAPAASASFDALAAALKPELRASDLLGRLPGGLAVVLVHVNPDGPDSVTARLRMRLAALGHGSPIRVFQVGTATFSPDCGSADELISRARTKSTIVKSLH